MKTLNTYFETAIKHSASDLHLVAGRRPMVRIHGELVALKDDVLPSVQFETAVMRMLNLEQRKHFEENWELDFGYELGNTRFRVNVHRQEGAVGLTARLIPTQVPSPETLRFEPSLQQFTQLLDGLVLVVGPTGHGKSTTLASMINEINKNRKAHIVTVEDPIEFVFQDEQSLIEQREVGSDTKSFANALKYVLRQDPNVILVGEMRDPETISTVLTAAETGHLVFSTLHTSSAAEAVERIVDVFDGSRQKQVLVQLGAVLRGIVAQQLIPSVDGGRVAAREILINTSAVSNLIRENNITQIYSAIQTGNKEGMQTMETSLKQLVKEGLIEEEIAQKRAGKQKRF